MASMLEDEPRSRSSVGIGEAARRVGLTPSAIRFYESKGLLTPAPRSGGRRRYGPEELRTLAFIRIGRDLGLGLGAVGAALHPQPGGWAALVDEQIALLDAEIARAQQTRAVLVEARECPAPEPVRECPHLRAALDAVLERP